MMVKNILIQGESHTPISKNDKFMIIENGLIQKFESMNQLHHYKYISNRINITNKYLVPGFFDVKFKNYQKGSFSFFHNRV
jgi:N-acetylglucosamine-6-phosphate deacetylase